MSKRYIDVDKFAEKICSFQQIDEDAANAMIWLLRTFPTADVVEVVRCRDCKWWTKQKDSAQGRCDMHGRCPTGAWYCANGERREK